MLFQVVILLPILVHTLLASQLYEHAEINFACPCFVDFTTQYYAGLGHRMMEYTIGLHIAYDVGCTFITHSRMLESHGLHGNYSDIASLLGVFEGDLLDNDEQRYAHLIRTKKQPDYPFTRDPNECHVLYELQQQSCPSGNERYCFQVPHIIEDVAWLLRAKAAPALQHVCGAHQLDAEQHIAPSTVFHLRVGDIVIDHGATYYQNLLAEVARAAPGSDVLVLHSCPSCRPGTLHSQFSGIFPASCAKLGLRCRFAAHLTVYDSLAAMACADLLVTSGSMFSILASLVTRAAVIFVDNKDEACPQCCSQPHFAFPANDGTLVPLERAKLKAQLTVGHADGTRRFLVPDHLLPVEPTQQSYAQCGQDFIIDKLFSDRPREEPRFYVDLAANHPLILSNTYLLDRKRGWRGLCIEANPNYWYPLMMHRTCTVVGGAIADGSHVLPFRFDGVMGGIVGDAFDNKPAGGAAAVDVPSMSLLTVLEASGAPTTIDYLSLDVEGAEFLLMKDFPYHKYKFLTLTVERPGVDLSALLEKNGYRFVLKTSYFDDELWFHKDFLAHFRGSLDHLRDGFTGNRCDHEP